MISDGDDVSATVSLSVLWEATDQIALRRGVPRVRMS